MSIYFPSPYEGELAAIQTSRHELADAVRRLVGAIGQIDTSATSVAALDEARAAVDRVAALVDTLPVLDLADRSEWPAHDHGQTERGPVIGRANPAAPPMRVEHHGDHVKATVVLGLPYEGAPGDVHGGVIAALFDELLGCTQLLSPVAGRTGTLTVKYRAVTPVGARLDLEGRIDRVEGRKVFCRGTLHHGDVLLAEAEGIFIGMRPPPS